MNLDTPFLRLDLDLLDRNVGRMVEACQQQDVQWRPHAKCHKSPELARQLLNAGAVGMTCAKLGEAEVFAQSGIKDLLVANMIAGAVKCDRLAKLCSRADPLIALDHIEQALPIQEALDRHKVTLRALIEVDIGMQRVGTQPGQATLQLAQQLESLPRIELVGLMAYEGHLLIEPDLQVKRQRIFDALDQLAATRDLLIQSGFACDIVSCGGTGSFQQTLAHPVVTELQAGGAIFMDAFYRHQCQVDDLEFALCVVTTVVSRPTADRAVIDAGRKTLNIEIETPRVLGRPDLRVTRLSAEHGEIHVPSDSAPVRIGDQLSLIPGYADLTTNLHDQFYGFRDGQFARTIPIAARGKVQ